MKNVLVLLVIVCGALYIIGSLAGGSSSSSGSSQPQGEDPSDAAARHAVVNYGCTGTTLGYVIALASLVDDTADGSSAVTGSASSGRIKLVSIYSQSQGGGRKSEYKFSYDTQTGKVSGENASGQEAMRTLAAAKCFP